jgi:hypothetical protein
MHEARLNDPIDDRHAAPVTERNLRAPRRDTALPLPLPLPL